MAYRHLNELPAKVQASLPLQAQIIYLSAYNEALIEYTKIKGRDHSNITSEQFANNVAWAAVKNKYCKNKKTKRWKKRKE